MKAQYEQQATELLEWVKTVVGQWESEHDTDNLEEAQAQVDRLKKFVLEDEPTHQAAKLDLEALYAQIQTQLKVNGRQQYGVPSELSPDAVEEAFHQLYLARQQYARKARDNRFRFIQKEETHLSDDKVAEFKDSFSHFDTVRTHRTSRTTRMSVRQRLPPAVSPHTALSDCRLWLTGQGRLLVEGRVPGCSVVSGRVVEKR